MGSCNCENCGNCGGCGKSLTVTPEELKILELLGQIPFLPVCRKREDMVPVYPDDPREEISFVLQCLERKNLISIDYDAPLRGTAAQQYGALPVKGSMALTTRGQWVLESVQIHGIGQ